jgi:hypothetical protein
MSENKPITPKEKMLTGVLVRLYSKETLEKEIRDVLESYDEKSKLILGAAKLLGIDYSSVNKIGLQYLNYAVENYEKIQNKEFPEQIERVVEIKLYAEEVESVIQYNRKRVTLNTLEKYLEEIEDRIWDNYYEYDPDTLDVDYGDSDFMSVNPDKEATEINDYYRNVLN